VTNATIAQVLTPARDAHWLAEFRRGDSKTLVDVYGECGEIVFRFLRQRVASPADARDLTQEVFLTAFQDNVRRQYSGTSPIRSFLLGVARNVFLHHLRSQRVRDLSAGRFADFGSEEHAPSVEDVLQEKETDEILTSFLGTLAANERDFFVQHMMERPARRVTAERFGMTVEKVRYLEKRLRDRAITHLKQTGYLEAPRSEKRRQAVEASDSADSDCGMPFGFAMAVAAA
jgi:RNA polymerase sigma-70 factor (ECF subfamily)